MSKVGHVIGNGDTATAYKQGSKGLKVTCNLPPFPVPGTYTTCMVDYKMMMTIDKGEIVVPGEWTLGARPKHYCETKPNFYMRHASQIKGFYTHLPKYCNNYTDFNCGHFAVHMTANLLKCDEIHMYGFNSIFDFDLRSCTDFYLNSDRGGVNNERLSRNWRPIWMNMFKEFPNKQFVLYHKHDALKFPKGENVEIKIIS